MSSKYEDLARYLEKSTQDMIRMSFSQVENEIRGELPPAAKEHRAWWSNSMTHSHARHGWLHIGYETAKVDMDKQNLIFYKTTNQKAEIRRNQIDTTFSLGSLSRSRNRTDTKLESVVSSAGGVDNITKIADAIQRYIDGDMLETELGQILRKLWPRT